MTGWIGDASHAMAFVTVDGASESGDGGIRGLLGLPAAEPDLFRTREHETRVRAVPVSGQWWYR